MSSGQHDLDVAAARFPGARQRWGARGLAHIGIIEHSIAVDLNGEPAGPTVGDEDAQPPASTASRERDDDLRGRILAFLDGIGNSLSPGEHEAEELKEAEAMLTQVDIENLPSFVSS